jgi:hypothetical protein
MVAVTYCTMTVGGMYGADFTAETDDEATLLATKSGYKVLDITQHAGELVLVVAD